MRVARPALLAVLLLLALVPTAGAHDENAPNHRDTPADLAGADITHTLAVAHLARTVAPSLARFLPTDAWCGTRLTTDDIADAAFPATLRQIKVVYAYASGGPDRSAAWSDALQANVSNIDQYLALQTGGRRALRFDMGTDCGPQYVDVQVVALPQTRTYYRDDPTQFNRVANDVATALGPAPGPRDVFILADELTDDNVWGIAEVVDDDRPDSTNASNAGGLTAIMWTNPTTQPDPSDPWQPTVMLHEITHNLGGVQQSSPHHTSNWHCTDGEDVMCYPDQSPEAAGYNPNVCPLISGAVPQTYDCGHDDYFNPDPAASTYLATHWNVYRSSFMGACTGLGLACGDNIVPTIPVNTALPAVTGSAQRGGLVAAGFGTWLNTPTSYALQWQRGIGADWASIPGASSSSYVPTSADVGATLRVVVTAANDDGAAVVASGPTGPVVDVAAAPPAHPPAVGLTVHIALRDRARHKAGTLAAKIRSVPAGREVRTAAARVSLPAGTWRLRLCAGPKRGSLRCTLTKRVRTRKRGVRLPSAVVVVRGTSGALRITAAAVDGRHRIRANGQAATA